MKIKVKGEVPRRPTKLRPPGDRRSTVIIDPGRLHPPQLPVYITREAYLTMMEHSVEGGAIEVGGFLLGGYHHYRRDRYVDITEAVPALQAKGEKTHLTFDNDVQKAFHATVGKRYPGKLVLGWYHTHPRYSVFLSEHDLFIHRSFFSAEYHVAVVVDPYQHRGNRVGVFLWEEDDVSQGYHLIVYESEE